MHVRQKVTILATIIALVCLFSFLPVRAEPESVSPVPLPEKTVPAETKENFYQKYGSILRDERLILEKQADRQIAGIERIYDRGLYLFGAILGMIATILLIALGIFYWQFGRTRKELREEIRDMMKGYAKESVDQEAEELKRRLRLLRNEVDDINSYRSRSIVWVTYTNHKAIEPTISALQSFHISNIFRAEIHGADELELHGPGYPDLVILSFDGTDLGRQVLKKIVDQIKSAHAPIPLLIFTYNFGRQEIRLSQADFAILQGFDWYLPANVPATLISQTTSLLRRSRDTFGA